MNEYPIIRRRLPCAYFLIFAIFTLFVNKVVVVVSSFSSPSPPLLHQRKVVHGSPSTASITKRSGIAWKSSVILASAPAVTEQQEVNGDASANDLFSNDSDMMEDDPDAFATISRLTTAALYRSDIKRDAKGKKSGAQSSSATNWIDDQSSFVLQQAMNRLILKLPDQRQGVDRDEALAWTRWMKLSPTPLIVDLSKDLQSVVNETITDEALETIESTRVNFLQRIHCQLILLPSGAEPQDPLRAEPTGGIIFGKLLYGGVTRYRLLSSSNSRRPPRRAGERSAVKASIHDNVPSWIQFGGAERKYEAFDMGPAAILEVSLLPTQGLQTKESNKDMKVTASSMLKESTGDMTLSKMYWSPHKMFSFQDDDDIVDYSNGTDLLMGNSPSALSGKDRNDAFNSDFRSAVGGLQPQIDAIVRRVLDGRIIQPADDNDDDKIGTNKNSDGTDKLLEMTTAQLSQVKMEAEELELLGLSPVRGLLMYGPPGCGKTALAREISRALRAREPKIVSAPELLDRWVGGSEKLIRTLFADAEAELAACNGDASKSALHVIVIDEIDAVFRKRSSAEDSGEATRSSAVNQILAKLDGVHSIPNVLLVGMTNCRELLDEALLRPGRLEVQIEIPLPDREGRREILQIHFEALRKKGRLSKQLCCAIDGVRYDGVEETDTPTDTEQKSKRFKRSISRALSGVKNSLKYDLASDSVMGGFSGADVAGLVRAAGSLALARSRKDGSGLDGLLITLEDVKEALVEVKK